MRHFGECKQEPMCIDAKRNHVVVLAGPVPPPYTGQAIGTEVLLNSPIIRAEYALEHLSLSFEGASTVRRIALTIAVLLQFGWLALRRRPQLVHLMVSRSALGFVKDCVLVHVSRIAGARVIAHVRGGDLQTFYAECCPLLRRVIKATYAKVACGIALGPSLRKQFAGLVRSDRVYTVLNCYKEPPVVVQTPRSSESKNKCLRVLFLSNVLPSKGLFDALHGVAGAVRRGVPIRFVFAGQFMDHDPAFRRLNHCGSEDPNAASLERMFDRLVRELGLVSIVEKLGTVRGAEKWSLLQRSDILLLPVFNPWEGQPLTIIEAMRAGCAVISTDCGGIADLVEHNVTGRIVRPRCPSDISDGLEYYWQHCDELQVTGHRNQRRALDLHSPENHASSIMRLYECLVS